MGEVVATGELPQVHAGPLVAKLALVMAEVERIPKRGHNAHFGYDYATEADITSAIRQKLAAQKVMIIPSVTGLQREGTLTTVQMVFTFYDGESGAEISVPWAGVGEDKSDKGIWKAMTGAIKYLLLKTFLIPTGDDPEADATEKPRNAASAARPQARPAAAAPPSAATITADQRKAIFTRAKARGWNSVELRKLLKTRFSVEASDKLPAARYEELCKVLDAGIDAPAKAQGAT